MSVDTVRQVGRRGIGKPFPTKLYPRQKALLEEMADCFGLDMSEIVREALDEKLEKMRRQAIRLLETDARVILAVAEQEERA